MIEILKDADRRLVITLGPGNKRRARFVLDKDSGQAWFERRSLLPSRTVQTALADIAGIEAAGHRLIIVLKSGPRHVFAGDPDGVRDAAAKMQGFVGSQGATSEAAHPRESLAKQEASPEGPRTEEASFVDLAKTGSVQAKQLFGRRPRGRAGVGKSVVQGAIGFAVLALLVFAGLKIPDFFILPGCDAQRTRDTLHDLLQKRAQGPIALTDFSTISRTKTEYRCSADIAVNGDHATVGYRSSWDGFSAMVRVTGTLGTARLDPARMRAVDEAYDAFMARATDAYQSGEPPRQSEPIVNTQLATILDVAALPAKTLVGSEIDEAIRWFNSGDTVGAVYLLAGTGVNDVAQLPSDDATQRKLRENVVKYSDEYGRYLDFQITLLAAIADAQANFSSGGPPDEIDGADYRRKVSDIRALLAQALKTDIISLVYDGLTSDWRLARLDAIARVGPIVTRVLPSDELAAIRDQANLTLPYFSSDATVRLRVSAVTGTLGR